MTSKFKCPVCKVPLTECGDLLSCPNDHCGWVGNAALWQALIQAKQDLETAKADIEDYKKYKALWEQIRNNTILELERKLEITRKAMNQVMSMGAKNNICYHLKAKTVKSILGKALEQIEHKEQRDE